MPKTPDEIKKGLECCATVKVGGICPFDCPLQPLCASGDDGAVQREILALIQQLQAENAEKDERIQQLEAENAQLLEKADRFSKVAFEQNMVILGKQDIITKQERRRANYESEIWQLKQQMPRWISVEERLPERDKEVLCLFVYPEGTSVCQNVYYGSGHWLGEGDHVTHWMPLPELPKEAP